MPPAQGERYDFFLSRRGSVAAVAREVADVLTEKGYKVLVQDYDISVSADFVERMHDGIVNSRDLIVLSTHDYLEGPYSRKEFTSFEAERAQSTEERHIIVLRCEDVPMRDLLADNVFQDLVGVTDTEERKRRIIAAAERQSQRAQPPPRPFIGVPPRIASFTGRAEELDRLDAILMRDKPAAVTQSMPPGKGMSIGAAVQGLGGVGKTSLAVEYAHRYRQLYAGVCWCPAETRTGLLSSLAALGVKMLGAPTAGEADVETAGKAALQQLSEQRSTWLLVYDNVTGPDEIADLLPSGGARVLITSRFPEWSQWADEVSLDVLPVEEAVSFLQKRTGWNYVGGAKTLAATLGCLPLALDHGAAFCKRTQMRFLAYATKASTLIAAVPRGVGYSRSVAATFDLAINEAVAQCASADPMMAFLAQCAAERIPMTLVEGAIDNEEERKQALAALVDVSLVKHDPFEDGTPAVTVHRLVQEAARVRGTVNNTIPEAMTRIIGRLGLQYPEDAHTNRGAWPLCAQLTPHLLALRDAEPAGIAPIWSDLLNRAGNYFHGRASYVQAASLLRDALTTREKAFGPEHPETADSLSSLAMLLRDGGDLSGARPLFERAFAIREKVLGPEHPHTATSLKNLVNLLGDQGDLAGARPFLERTLAGAPEHPDMATSLHSLALLLMEQGDLAGARPFFERALAIREKVLGRDHPDTASSLNHLATLLRDQHDLAEARPLLDRVLTITESVLGPDHPNTATSLTNLAHLLQANDNLAGAELLFERALAINEKVGSDRPDMATDLSDLACVLNRTDHVEEAEPVFQRAIAIGKKILGPDHPLTQRYCCCYARLLIDAERPTEALATAAAALAVHAASNGPTHPWTKDSARVTSDALYVLGRDEEAAALRGRFGLTRQERPAVS
jgi:tetratricopeptide (TPR) repeat protein